MSDAVAVMKQFHINLTPAVQTAAESKTTTKMWRKRSTNMKYEIMNAHNFAARKQYLQSK